MHQEINQLKEVFNCKQKNLYLIEVEKKSFFSDWVQGNNFFGIWLKSGKYFFNIIFSLYDMYLTEERIADREDRA